MLKKLLLLGGTLMILSGCVANMQKRTETAADPLPGLLQSVARGEASVVKLKNGLTVLIKEDDRFPLANVRLYVHAGSGYENPKIAGISHLLEHMVFKGTEKRGPGQSARDAESAGGSMNAATSFDYTMYYVEVPADKYALGMDIVTDMAFNAKIDPGELSSEKEVVLAELARGEDNPGSKIFKSLQSMIWKGTSYEWPIIGFEETVRSLSDKDIHAYIDEFYQPQSMLLAVVGKVDPKKVLAEAEALLGDRKNTRPVLPPEPIAVPETGSGPQVVKLEGNWNKVYLGAALPIPHGSSAEIPVLEMLAQILGGDDTSRLYRKFKYEEQLVDDISMGPLSLERGGMMYIFATLDADKVEPFWDGLMRELDSFDPASITDQEIERARLNLEDSMFLAKETLSGLAGKLGYFQFFENGIQAENNYLFGLQQTGRRELGELYEKYFTPEKMAVTVLVPEGNGVDADRIREITELRWPLERKAETRAVAASNGEREIALPGGSRLILLPDTTLPYTAMSLFWTGGDGLLSPDQAGLAALTANALTRGTTRMSATEIEDYLSDRASSVAASAARNAFALEAKFPSRFTGELLPLLRDILTSPAWNGEEIARAKQDQTAAIERREDTPLGLAFRRLFPFLFKTAPYSMLHQGTEEQITNFAAPDIMGFWARQSMQPFVMAVCGDFDEKTVEEFAAGLSRDLTDPGMGYDFVTPEWGTDREETLHLPDRNQSHLLMVFPAPGKTDMETTARLNVLKAALNGQSGLLFRDMRDKQGLGYTVTSIPWQGKHAGLLALYIGTSPDKTEQALDGFRKVAEDLRTTLLPEAELERARNILTGEYYQEHQSLMARSRQAASLEIRGFDRNLDQEIIERAKLVTPEDIRELARAILDPEKAYLMKVQP
ncbi:M16 family metallopeptidase [Pseudodesulfovibrio tunisiensis]|uniref:M16 family metallopeptidase n=1 Tax=Pseudodesulfovibrio tunisiensis TaxID=463192 RepID=UPI001FB465BB|nr:pitrilysin family protein [Pseudodesulfovibrio tunisiensis]